MNERIETEEQIDWRHLRELTVFRAAQKRERLEWAASRVPIAEAVPARVRVTVQARSESFLRVYLADGGQSFREIVSSASKVGLRLEPLRKAKAALKIESYKVHLLWYWRFPQVVEGSHEDDVSISS